MQKKLKDLTLKNETKFEDDDHSRIKATFEKPRKSDSSQILKAKSLFVKGRLSVM